MLCSIELCFIVAFFLFKQKTAYEMRISDWSSTCALPILFGDHLEAAAAVEPDIPGLVGFEHASYNAWPTGQLPRRSNYLLRDRWHPDLWHACTPGGCVCLPASPIHRDIRCADCSPPLPSPPWPRLHQLRPLTQLCAVDRKSTRL